VVHYLLDIFKAENIKIIKNVMIAPNPNPNQNIRFPPTFLTYLMYSQFQDKIYVYWGCWTIV